MPPRNKQNTTAAGSESSPPAAPQDGFSLIANQKLLQLYAAMLKCRMLDECIRAERDRLMPANRVTRDIPLPARHREAALVGVLIDLLAEDTVSAPAMDVVPGFIKGAPLVDLFRLLRKPSATAQPVPAHNSAAVAAGATRAKANNKISVFVSGNDVAAQKSWNEALHLASLHRLPTVFVCWKPRKSRAVDFPIMTVDACDVVAVYRVASESIAHARQGFGPTFIECRQWNGPDATHDPLRNMQKYLDRKGLFNKEIKSQIATAFRAELDAALSRALGRRSRTARAR